MIGRLTGIASLEDGEAALVVDVRGVGYEVIAPLGTLGRAGSQAGAEVTLFIHTHVREDQITLFGFASAMERSVFQSLLSVASVGPKTAVAVLSALSVDELAEAVKRREVTRLTRVPGIGKKTAERLILELDGKLPESRATQIQASTEAGTARGATRHAEAVLFALTSMGYKPAEAERAIATLGDRVHSEPVSALVRDALASLVR